MIRVRSSTPDDKAAWLRMRKALWPETDSAWNVEEVEQYFQGKLQMPLEVLLAVDGNGAPVGFAELSIRSYAEGCQSERVAYLEGWYVVPEARRRGVGRKLLDAAEAWAVSRNCPEFGSDCLIENEISAAAHRAVGFVETARIRCFRRSLDAPVAPETPVGGQTDDFNSCDDPAERGSRAVMHEPADLNSPKAYLDFECNLNSADTVAAYDELPLWSAMFGLMLLEHVPLARNLRVLDVGCGTGFPALELAQRLGPTCTVIALDPWEAALERARFKARTWAVTNVEFQTGDASAIPFADAHFDLVVSNLGLNNFNDPDASVAECRRVMKPSARLALTSNLQGHMAEFYEVFEATLRDLNHPAALDALQQHIAHRATVADIRALLERNGLRVTRAEEASASMRFLDGSALLRHHFIKLGFLGAWKDVLKPDQQLEAFEKLETNLNRWAESHGELRLTIPMAYVEAEKPIQEHA